MKPTRRQQARVRERVRERLRALYGPEELADDTPDYLPLFVAIDRSHGYTLH